MILRLEVVGLLDDETPLRLVASMCIQQRGDCQYRYGQHDSHLKTAEQLMSFDTLKLDRQELNDGSGLPVQLPSLFQFDLRVNIIELRHSAEQIHKT